MRIALLEKKLKKISMKKQQILRIEYGVKKHSKGFKIIYEPTASVYHYHGVHQNLNKERAKNVVNILESLKTFKNKNNKNFNHDLKFWQLFLQEENP